MDLALVSSDVLQAKRENWIKPGERTQPVQQNQAKLEFIKNQAKFFGATPMGTANNKEKARVISPFANNPDNNSLEFNQARKKFFGVNSRDNSIQNTLVNKQIKSLSRPISGSTEFQINFRKFYSATPSEELLFKKNAKGFYNHQGNYNSPLVSAGRNLVR